MSKDLNLKSLPEQAVTLLRKLQHYVVVLFLVLVVVVYAYVLLRINSMQNAKPSSLEGSSKVTVTATPRIDPNVISQLKQLQDNSVSVKSLFDQARSNPFQD